MTFDFDAIVLGAGAAIHAAERGRHVLLLEKILMSGGTRSFYVKSRQTGESSHAGLA